MINQNPPTNFSIEHLRIKVIQIDSMYRGDVITYLILKINLFFCIHFRRRNNDDLLNTIAATFLPFTVDRLTKLRRKKTQTNSIIMVYWPKFTLCSKCLPLFRHHLQFIYIYFIFINCVRFISCVLFLYIRGSSSNSECILFFLQFSMSLISSISMSYMLHYTFVHSFKFTLIFFSLSISRYLLYEKSFGLL